MPEAPPSTDTATPVTVKTQKNTLLLTQTEQKQGFSLNGETEGRLRLTGWNLAEEPALVSADAFVGTAAALRRGRTSAAAKRPSVELIKSGLGRSKHT